MMIEIVTSFFIWCLLGPIAANLWLDPSDPRSWIRIASWVAVGPLGWIAYGYSKLLDKFL
jgi:hypothetical protein